MKNLRGILLKTFALSVVLSFILSTNAAMALIINGTVDEIILNKTVTETTDGSLTDEHGNVKQTYDINSSVTGKIVYPGAPVDIVLTIDLSNSMTSNNSQNLAVTKTAATQFINTVLADNDTAARIAIVSYGTYARAYNFSSKDKNYKNKWDLYGSTNTSDVYYTKDKAAAVAVINNSSFSPATLNPAAGKNSNDYTSYESGGTNTEAGFRVTKAVTDTRNRPNASSIVVFMTDGIPTYRCSGTSVTGSGSSTAASDFNNAVTAAKELKQAGNEIYTVGLLTSYTSGSYQQTMANSLLSDEASYTASGSGSSWTYTKNGGAYSTKYYKVLSASQSSSEINEIYTALTKKSFALASGTVTDTIPADFAVIDENKADLEGMGHTVTLNSNGTTTVIFKDVLASETVSNLPTIKVRYKGDGYGTLYTSTNATYDGKLYNGTVFSKTFRNSVAGLIPATINDKASGLVNDSINIDVVSNDKFQPLGFSVTDYGVSNYQIKITDKSGSDITYSDAEHGFTATVANGKVIFKSSTDTEKEFYYVVYATATGGALYAKNNSTKLVSRPTKVTVTLEKPEPLPDTAINLKGVNYAYIFGYEPEYKITKDAEGNEVSEVIINMAMDDNVTREQVAAMLMRLLDQTFDTTNISYKVTPNIAVHQGTWYERGLAYVASKGAFDGIETVNTGAITRGEVAKLMALGMNLSLTTETNFTDIANSEYAPYIKKMVAYGYMNGTSSTTFEPDKIMTRAQFCALFNNIIGRNERGLTALDKNGNPYTVTAETYKFSDMNPSHWAYETCLKATSAYDKNGYVDIEARTQNIRNKLDKYNSQTEY